MSLLTQLLPKKEMKEYFLTLGVEEYHVRAAVAEVSDKGVTIIGMGESDFGEDVDEIEAVDIAISTAEEKLPEDTLVTKAIFALPQIYIEGDNVKSEYLARLKNISKTLDLKPQGFIEYPTAVSFFLEKEEGSPPTLLLISIEKKHLTFSLIRVGITQQSFITPRTPSVASDLEKILPQFKSEILPSRLLLFDGGEELEEIREELLRFPWHKHSSFLHTPKIEILPSVSVITAIVQTAGSSFLKKIEIREEEKNITHTPADTTVAKAKPEEKIPAEESFGFIKGQDVAQPKVPVFVTEKETVPIFFPSKIFSIRLPQFSFSLPGIPFFLGSLFPFLAIAFVAISLILSLIWFYPKTTLTLIVYPSVSTQKIDVTFTTESSQVDTGKNIILANSFSEEIKGDKTVTTSGKSKVGEKAHGDITIYNKTLVSKTFPKETTLQNGSLKFTLADEVRVASASDTGEGISFGKISTQVNAVEIGPEGNLSSGSTFAFKDFPETSYVAKNTQNFTGGTSRDVSAVSKDDQQKLENMLTEELAALAKQKLAQKLSVGEKILEAFTGKNIKSKKFSSDVGSEAKELSLSLTLTLKAYSIKESDLLGLANNSLSAAPNGFVIDKSKTGIKIDEVKMDKKNNISAKAVITAYFIPSIGTDRLKTKLAGKTYSETEEYLKTVEHIGGFKITNDSELPFLKDRLPFSTKNLNITITTR